MFHHPKPPVPNQDPQQQQELPMLYNQDEIILRSPRSGDISITWEHPEGTDVNLLLNQKKRNTNQFGFASLVGEIAQIIANTIFQSGEPYSFGGITFTPNGQDIYASLGPHSSYSDIIQAMQKARSTDLTTANQILKNLSKGCVDPVEGEGFDMQDLANRIFEKLDDSAKRLMAVLICETIRFGDDGACARMAMREIIAWYEMSGVNISRLFDAVFVNGNESLPQAIFSLPGGKSRMQNQIIGSAKPNDKFFEKDKEIMQSLIGFVSDDEDHGEDTYVYPLRTNYSSGSSIKTRDTVPKISPGFFTDPPSSTVPSPARVPFSAARTFENHDAIHFHLDEQSEEQENDKLAPLGEHFCKKCNLLYWRPFGRSDAPILNKCPNCHSTDSIIMIPDEYVAGLVIENHMKEGSITTFPNGTEGIFLNE